MVVKSLAPALKLEVPVTVNPAVCEILPLDVTVKLPTLDAARVLHDYLLMNISATISQRLPVKLFAALVNVMAFVPTLKRSAWNSRAALW